MTACQTQMFYLNLRYRGGKPPPTFELHGVRVR